jgi:hypothetical protein
MYKNLPRFSFILTILLLSACNQTTEKAAEPTFDVMRDIEAFVSQPTISPVGVSEVPVPIAYYVGSDEGLTEYELLNEDFTHKNLRDVQAKAITGTNGMPSAFQNHLKQQVQIRNEAYSSSELNAQGFPTVCTALTIASTGCHYLVESNNNDRFNAVWMQVNLPSRRNFNIAVEEDQYPGCTRNYDSKKSEIPYVFLGGHSQKISAGQFQNIDAGLQWNCGKDNWSLFISTDNKDDNGGRAIYNVSNWRLLPDQTVTLMLYVSPDNYPVILARGNWIFTDGRQAYGDIRYDCKSIATCLGKNWSYTGNNIKLRLEVNLAQSPSTNTRSGARFAGTLVKQLYLGNYNRTTNKWERTVPWNVSSSKSSSFYTGVQCVIPGTGYIVSGTANSTFSPGGALVTLSLPR